MTFPRKTIERNKKGKKLCTALSISKFLKDKSDCSEAACANNAIFVNIYEQSMKREL